MRTKITWLILAAMTAVVIVGVVDAVRGSASKPEAARAGAQLLEPSTTTAASPQGATEPTATTKPAAAAGSENGSATTVGADVPDHLPSCDAEQLRLGFASSEGLAALALRRVEGQPCRHGRARIAVSVRDREGNRVTVFGGNSRATQPAEFSDEFVQLLELPQMSCDPEGSFVVVGTVGVYAAQRTFPGSALPCNHG